MARRIGMGPEAEVYRAVVRLPANSVTKGWTKYEGPYDSIGAARARVTFWVNRYRAEDGTSTASGHVERAVSVWTPVD